MKTHIAKNQAVLTRIPVLVQSAAQAVLMVGGAEVALVAGQSQEALVSAIWVCHSEEPEREITTVHEGLSSGLNFWIGRLQKLAVPVMLGNSDFTRQLPAAPLKPSSL